MANNKPKTSQKADTTKVSAMDVCQTPPHALEPLYEHLERNGYTNIWESAHGPEQILVHTLRARGYNVIATDLTDGEEYNRFTYNPPKNEYHIEITNVPFSIKYEWLRRAFETKKPFAFLVPYETTFADKFQDLFKQYNAFPWLIEKLSPQRRINYKMPNKEWGDYKFNPKSGKLEYSKSSSQMPTCWITWGLDVYKVRSDHLRTFYVPMRNVDYDDNNVERITNGRKKEAW